MDNVGMKQKVLAEQLSWTRKTVGFCCRLEVTSCDHRPSWCKKRMLLDHVTIPFQPHNTEMLQQEQFWLWRNRKQFPAGSWRLRFFLVSVTAGWSRQAGVGSCLILPILPYPLYRPSSGQLLGNNISQHCKFSTAGASTPILLLLPSCWGSKQKGVEPLG